MTRGTKSSHVTDGCLETFFNDGWAEWLSDFHLYSANGSILVDAVINYDQLQNGCNAISEKLSLPSGLDVSRDRINAKGESKERGASTAELFTRSLDRRTAILFSREIEAFGFRKTILDPKPKQPALLEFSL